MVDPKVRAFDERRHSDLVTRLDHDGVLLMVPPFLRWLWVHQLMNLWPSPEMGREASSPANLLAALADRRQ
jgi:hypothetical protein